MAPRGRGESKLVVPFHRSPLPVRLKMKSFVTHVRRFIKSEDGPTAVEYAVMLALIIVVAMTAISAVGTQMAGQFNTIATTVGGLTP